MEYQHAEKSPTFHRSLLILALALLAPVLLCLPAGAAIAERCEIEPVRPFVSALPTAAACDNCDCYWSSECGSGKKCDYASGCTKNGKLDGTCTASTSAALATVDQMTEALTHWFDAYIATAIDSKDGLPDAGLVDKTTQLGLSERAQAAIRDEVINSLDVLLGFDITLPRGNCLEQDYRCLAQLRIPIDEKGSALLQAAKEGLVASVQDGNPSSLYATLEGFWKFTEYHPHHTGRCYPHGHHGHEESPLECHQDELGRIADHLISLTGGSP